MVLIILFDKQRPANYNTFNMRTNIIVKTLVMLFLLSGWVSAEPDRDSLLFSGRESKYEMVKALKSEISQMLVDNQNLELDYKTLKEQYRLLIQEVERYRKELGLNRADLALLNKKPEFVSKAKKGDMSWLQNELLLKKSKNAFLKSELLNLEEEEHLWELKLRDLKFEMRQVKLEYKENQYDMKKNYAEHEQSYENINTRLKRSLEKEEELKQEIKEMREVVKNTPKYVAKIEEEQKILNQEILKYKNLKEIKLKEISILTDKKLLADKRFETPLHEKNQQKQNLIAYIEKLQYEYDTLDQRVEQVLDLQNKSQGLYKQLIKLGRDNATLRKKIADAETQINILSYNSR